ncbi:hypothetical protein SKAU_G00038300 [Synaphobranchus kaupii]|uniref:HECT domain-containing protein n=1 Tax=Synaphobranchus kaupii TaxID=118154 RepID=A0A9Q1JHB2_SYNKA|nr:hypothetical protein SKAU_G00038300 [Synaphobranchus kaupii]
MICLGETVREFDLDQDDALGKAENHPLTTAQKARITAVSVGKCMIAVVRDNGKGDFCLQDERDRGKTENLSLKGEKIYSLSCGADYIVMVSEKGNVFQLNCQKKTYIPRLLNVNGTHVIQVVCGDHHTIALSRDGQLFTWGRNLHGQLGQGERVPGYPDPEPLLTRGIPLAMIAAGGEHSFALSLSGAVFAWGKNSTGQLGLGDKKDRHGLTLVKSLDMKRTVYISCGDEHTAVLTKGGLVFTFGSGEYGQLGHNSNRDEQRPRLVDELRGSRVTQIACGRHHTLAYVPSFKTIYSFGRGEQGQLGRGLDSSQNVPLPVQLSSEFDLGIGTIFAGGNQSVCSHETLPCLSRMMLTVDDKLVNRWISECDSKPWKTLKKEIMQTFSSASTLNGSFLNQSDDNHYQTTMENSGLDLSLARLAFERLAKKEKVLKQVGSVVQEKLIPSLCQKPAGVEGMRVYLILPELLRVLPMDRELCVKFSEAVCKLNPLNLKILESFFKSLVKVVHSTSTWFLHQMRTEQKDFRTSVEKTVAVLHKLYEVNYTASRKIEDHNFYINEMKLFIQFIGRMPGSENSVNKITQFMEILHKLTMYPCIFDMETKCMVFAVNNCAMVLTAQMAPSLQNHLHVNRRSLLTDTFQGLKSKARDCRWPLLVQFEDEYRMVPGGVVQEFFTIFAREIHLMEPRMLELHEDSRLVWFMPEGRCDHDAYYLLGIVCGMALYNKCVVNFHFPLALFKKLLGLMLTLEDLKELSPNVARNLQEVLHEDEDVLELLDLDFTAKGHEIVPNGREIPVTKYNRQKYVETYVDFIFNKSVKNQFSGFLVGFSQGCPNELWTMFLPEELIALLSGNVVYVWEDLQKNAKYQAYEPTDENIQNFWTVFTELSEEKKKNFLSYMTGSDRLPVGGLAEIKLTIVNQNKPNPDDFYPVALTCHCWLFLPNYSSIHILREKFVHAISFYEGFAEQ